MSLNIMPRPGSMGKNLDYINLLEYSVPCDLFGFTDDHAVRDVQ